MRYYDYSWEQLETKAVEFLAEFDKERLYKTKPIDVYAVIEKCLDVPYDWKYLTPDQSVLGATAFHEGYIWVWPESRYYDGLMPYQIYAAEGTIFIEATLTEQDNRGRENFTVMHEVFHQVLHKKCFRDEGKGYIHSSYKLMIEGKRRYASSALKTIEWQANCCAAAFLMPAELTEKEYRKRIKNAGAKTKDYYFMKTVIDDMAEDFSVSKLAMCYRLRDLGMIDEHKENLVK